MEQLKYSVEKYPKISVITTSFNRVDTIEEAIKSFLIQGYPNAEYLVLDAASTDGTVDVIKRYQDKIDFFRSHKDNGAADAINEGIRRSTGEIIALLNSDDYFEPGILIKVGEAFIENPDTDLFSFRGRVVEFEDNGEIKYEVRVPLDELTWQKDRVNTLYTLFRFYRKSLYEKYGAYLEVINGRRTIGNDCEHIMRLGMYDVKNICIDHLGYTCRAHSGSLTFSNSQYNKLVFSEEKIDYIDHLYKNYSKDISDEYRLVLDKEYKKMFPRIVVKNLVDKHYKNARKNLKVGINKYGLLFIFKVIRYYLSYILRFNKIGLEKKKELKKFFGITKFKQT